MGVDRRDTISFGVLIITGGIAVTRLILFVEGSSGLLPSNIPPFLGLVFALIAVGISLCMPFRSPKSPKHEICVPFDSPTHKLRSPEDNLTLWQFMSVSWMSPLIRLGFKRQLNEEDVWSLAYEFQHKSLHERFRDLKGSVVKRLLLANGLDLIMIAVLAIIECFARISGPVLLQQILRSMGDPRSPRRDVVTFAALSLLLRLIATQSTVFNQWYSRRCYERSRGEMITMVFEKTLSRKIINSPKKSEHAEDVNGDIARSKIKAQASPFSCQNLVREIQQRLKRVFQSSKKDPQPKEPASMGKILNIMRNDVYQVAQRFWDFKELLFTPLTAILSIILIWKLIGWPCLFGVLTIFVAQGLNAIFIRILLRWEVTRREATDTKLQKITQFVEAIRHLRWYGWQDFWRERIMESRQKELYLRVITSLWRSVIFSVNTLSSGLFPVAAFFAYTVWAGLPLRVDIAFPALQLFSMLESNLGDLPNLITTLLNAKIAVDRIEDFMSEPDKDIEQYSKGSKDTPFILAGASFAWPGTSQPVLHTVNLIFPVGLTVVTGKVAAGKTALLQGLLGELDRLEGHVSIPNQPIGYCAQTPWLQSMNIRENILFSNPFDETRYKETLEACALIQDFASFQHGDLSNIGENGIGLSGGQKARVALARAVYSSASILLLDDPLSALDHDTAATIVRKLLSGPLVKDRIVVLVTHRVDLCRRLAAQMIKLENGRAHVVDHEVADLEDLSKVESLGSTENAAKTGDKQQEQAAVPEKFLEDEKREHGGVKGSVYWEFIKAGKLQWWALLICAQILARLVLVGETWFLKEWSESYDKPSEFTASGLFDSLPSPERNIKPWLLGFFFLAVASSVSLFISQCVSLLVIYTAGRQMFKDIMLRVSHATFRFYDTTPVGRLMNRMTSDIGTVDGEISMLLVGVTWLFVRWTTSIAIIASVTPVFLVFALALTASFVAIFRRFLPTSQSLRRMEMVSLSPLMSNFGALVEGLVTVRAFAVQSRFQDRVIEVTDAFQKMDHFYWSLQAWLTYRFESLSAISTFLITLLALYAGVSPGLTAFLLTAAAQFVTSTHGLCRMYGNLEMDFVSVERVVEMLHLEQEPQGSIDPPAAWPSYKGDIVFENVTMRYAPHLDPSLSDISLRIPPGATTALLGRTGSGKSTLALSLLATVRPEPGRIIIDGIDISKVNTQALRERITFLAQDPVLFPGSLRDNLDPLHEYTDEACEAVLQRVCAAHNWTIDTQIDAGGKNLSQGQRQLVGLARAVLRRSAIVILDEATASIDMETAMSIQQILREEMKESTVITIAHRLEAVKDATHFIRLEKGRVASTGEAATIDDGSGANRGE
ncbi:hypothetical protein ACLMJK_006367 [Lecanora helva]